MSDKREAFKRLSAPRIQKAVKSIKLLGNLSRASQYEYSTLEAHQLIDALQSEVDNLRKLYKLDKAPAKKIEDPDPEIDQIDDKALSWVSWALDNLVRGELKEAREMLKRGIQINRERARA